MGWTFKIRNRPLQDFMADRLKSWDWTDTETGKRHVSTVIAHKYKPNSPGGGSLWAVRESATYDAKTGACLVTPHKWIALDLIKWGGGTEMGWGYKDLSASMGPCEVNCPLEFLDLAPAPTPCPNRCTNSPYGETACKCGGCHGCSNCYETAWREKVRAYHADRAKVAAKPKPKPGDVIRFAEPIRFGSGIVKRDFPVVQRGRSVAFVEYGIRYRIRNWKTLEYEINPTPQQAAA